MPTTNFKSKFPNWIDLCRLVKRKGVVVVKQGTSTHSPMFCFGMIDLQKEGIPYKSNDSFIHHALCSWGSTSLCFSLLLPTGCRLPPPQHTQMLIIAEEQSMANRQSLEKVFPGFPFVKYRTAGAERGNSWLIKLGGEVSSPFPVQEERDLPRSVLMVTQSLWLQFLATLMCVFSWIFSFNGQLQFVDLQGIHSQKSSKMMWSKIQWGWRKKTKKQGRRSFPGVKVSYSVFSDACREVWRSVPCLNPKYGRQKNVLLTPP